MVALPYFLQKCFYWPQRMNKSKEISKTKFKFSDVHSRKSFGPTLSLVIFK
jgi:hypothetical protein